jgi:plasmid stabilization system protein ParE
VTARWHPAALAEADAAAELYRDKRRELAVRFLNSLEEVLNRIELHPHIYREIESGVRSS